MTAQRFLVLAAAAAACFAGAAQAQEATSDDWMILPQPQTAAQQKAAQAEEDARVEAQAKRFPDGLPGKTRAEVRSELMAARRDGSFARLHAEAWVPEDHPLLAPGTRLAHQQP